MCVCVYVCVCVHVHGWCTSPFMHLCVISCEDICLHCTRLGFNIMMMLIQIVFRLELVHSLTLTELHMSND